MELSSSFEKNQCWIDSSQPLFQDREGLVSTSLDAHVNAYPCMAPDPLSWFAVEKDKYGGKAWAHVWKGPSHVFFGHDAKRRLQLCPVATGLDTSCVYGFQLTCAVIPPLSQLLAPPDNTGGHVGGGRGSGQLASKLALRQPVTREDLGVEIVSVKAARAYLEPSAAAAAGPDPSEAFCPPTIAEG